MTAQQQAAKAELDKFANGKSNGQWANITRKDLVDGLSKRVAEPNEINQGNTNLCGPAVYFHALAIKDPVAYVKAAIDLWEQGSAKIGDLNIKTTNALKAYKIPKGDIDPADWILLASLRNSSNWVFSLDSVEDTYKNQLSGITYSKNLVDWFRNTGFKDVIDKTQVLGTPGIAVNCKETKPFNNPTTQSKYTCESSNANEASGKFNAGYMVGLLINSEMIPGQPKNSLKGVANHWVGLASPITIHPGTVHLSYYTWGNLKKDQDIPFMQFFSNYHGYVAGKM